MEFSGIETVLLITASAFGVAINTVTGGGSLITLPILLSVGIPLKQAFAVNMIALSIGGLGSVLGGSKSLERNPKRNFFVLIPTFLGAFIGANSLVLISVNFLEIILPLLMIISTMSLFLSQTKWRLDSAILSGIAIFFVSIYGGFFGAGMGVMLISILTIFNYGEIHSLTSLKNLQQVVINTVSSIIMLSNGLVLFEPTLLLTLGGLLGGYTTGKYLEHLSSNNLRSLMITIGLLLSIVFTAKLLIS